MDFFSKGNVQRDCLGLFQKNAFFLRLLMVHFAKKNYSMTVWGIYPRNHQYTLGNGGREFNGLGEELLSICVNHDVPFLGFRGFPDFEFIYIVNGDSV